MRKQLVPGRVSVVVVNYRGAEDTIACLDGLRDLDYPELEVIVVDNASGDGSAEVLTAQFPDAKVLALDENTGFAGGCNHGAAQATGQYVAFLNNDARPGSRTGSRRRSRCCTRTRRSRASRARCSTGRARRSTSSTPRCPSTVTASSCTSAQPESSIPDKAADVLFASGAAMVMPTDVFERVGGFDPRYFMFFEDVDLGWRLWLLGYRVRYVPESLVYHRHHRSMDSYGAWREHYLLERNALFTIYKNYDDVNLARVLPAALMLAIRRGVTLGGSDAHAAGPRTGERRPSRSPTISVAKQTLASRVRDRRARRADRRAGRDPPGPADGPAPQRPGDHAAVPAARSTRTSAIRSSSTASTRWSTRSG